VTPTYVLVSFVTPVLYALLTTAAYYLLARAMITKFLWSRYPKWLDYYTLCAACSGMLYGAAIALAIGWWRDLPFLTLPGRFWVTPIVVGLCSMIWTPILAAKHVKALVELGVPEARSEEQTTDGALVELGVPEARTEEQTTDGGA